MAQSHSFLVDSSSGQGCNRALSQGALGASKPSSKGQHLAIKAYLCGIALAGGLVLTGCQSNNESSISASEAFAQDQATIELLHNDYELVQQVSSQLNTANIYDQHLQPVNKKAKCLVPFMVANREGIQLYWDGDCKGGYASGLGRLVRTKEGLKTHEFLLEIPAPHKLISYLQYDLENMDVEAGYSDLILEDSLLKGHSATIGYNVQQWHNNNYNVTYRYEDTTNLMSYTKVVDLISGDVSSIIAYPNYSHDVLNAQDNALSTVNRTYRLLEGSDMVGFAYIWLKSGQLVMRDVESGQDTVVANEPSELGAFVADIERKVDQHAAKADQEVDLGLKKVDEYRNTKCPTHRGFFRGDEVSAVCEFIDEFRANYDRMQDAREEHVKTLDSYKPRQEKSLQELEKHLQELKISLAGAGFTKAM